MTKVIQQSVVFKASTKELFEIYVDSKKHTAATGAKASVSRSVGGRFSAWDGSIYGRNLVVASNRMIVQAWRAAHWKMADLDSILVITFSEASSGCRVDIVHSNVPEYDHKGVKEGWPKYYWQPWKAYLKKEKDEA